MNKNENNFLDPKTLIAIALVAMVWFGWQSYLSNKYPNMHAANPQVTVAGTNEVTAGMVDSKMSADIQAQVVNKKNKTPSVSVESKEYISSTQENFEISSYGMGIRNLKLNHYTKRDKSNIEFAQGLDQGLFELHLLNDPNPISFRLQKKAENLYEGTAQLSGATIIRSIEYSPETFSFKNTISVSQADSSFKGLSLIIPEKRDSHSSSGFLIGSYDHQEFLVSHSGNKVDTVNVTSSKDGVDKSFSQVSIVSVASQYFASALIDKSEIVPEVRLISKTAEPSFSAALDYKVDYKSTSAKDKLNFSFIAYSGPKSHAILEKADPELGGIIDLGFFAVIGRLLLSILKWFNTFAGNWGVSIILLTLLVRSAVLPFSIASYKSMKKMQKIQPIMQALRERYKADPQTMQRETMALMKKEGANPIGSCLPMLLQMPIFFALFRVLGQSIDLYQAPFFGWITDLSLKDPYYVLPILMGITLFIQQKITPTTMDPQQAKVMQFMPIIFSFMMVSLPSGLTLYTFVSTLFGIIQQRIFMRDRIAVVATKEIKI